MRLAGFGIAIELPKGWDGRLFRRPEGEATLHAATYGLPASDGDFGPKATRLMPDDGVLVVLTEYRRRLAGKGLYAPRGLPRRLRTAELNPSGVLGGRPGQAGVQRFFTIRGRPFCLYVVVGARGHGRRLVRDANDVLKTISIE